ncbi:hypothetical protein [Priestia endophytica]|uniref:hypothetical protein n=1 Tax=Priestia endophytica TaxID=135735 RepID=UPI0015585436|nr:hypothetical protein [Priestia endophytica]
MNEFVCLIHTEKEETTLTEKGRFFFIGVLYIIHDVAERFLTTSLVVCSGD